MFDMYEATKVTEILNQIARTLANTDLAADKERTKRAFALALKKKTADLRRMPNLTSEHVDAAWMTYSERCSEALYLAQRA